jgi:hypothetical protein
MSLVGSHWDRFSRTTNHSTGVHLSIFLKELDILFERRDEIYFPDSDYLNTENITQIEPLQAVTAVFQNAIHTRIGQKAQALALLVSADCQADTLKCPVSG